MIYGIYDGGPNAESFTKVGERNAESHDLALIALGDEANDGHIYAICGARDFAEASTLIFRRAGTQQVTETRVTSHALRSFNAEAPDKPKPLTPPYYYGVNSSIYR